MTRASRLLPPAVVDWGILAAVAVETASGLYSLVAGRPGQAWVFVLHGAVGFVLVGLLAVKFGRVASRVRPGRLTRTRGVSVLLAAAALAALATGIAWALGASAPVPFWTLLNVHMLLGLLVVPLLAWHLRRRWRPPETVARSADRRTALRSLALVGGGAVAWRLGEAAADLFGLPGAGRRFTGSRERGSGRGNAFPVTSWVADDPDPVDAGAWTLTVDGLVGRPLELDDGDLAPEAAERATLDCTSGWYSVHDWRGLRVGDLLDAAGVRPGARWVTFRSVTGYRWSLPVGEAREALLATHVEDERLSHGHGFPVRLVAPGRRGFQWIKWVERVEVRRHRDAGELLAIFLSGFDGD